VNHQNKAHPQLRNVTPPSSHTHTTAVMVCLSHIHRNLRSMLISSRANARPPLSQLAQRRYAIVAKRTCRKRHSADLYHSATASIQSSSASSVIVKTPSRPKSTRRPVLQVFLARTACRAIKCPPTVCRQIHSTRESRALLTSIDRPHPARRRLLRLDRRLRRRSPRAKPTTCLISTRYAQSQPTQIACRSCTRRENHGGR
jgi:hypothetical protein